MHTVKKRFGCLFLCSLLSLAYIPDTVSATQDSFSPYIANTATHTGKLMKYRGKNLSKSQFKKNFHKSVLVNDSSSLIITGETEHCDFSFKSSDSSILQVEKTTDTSCNYYGITPGKATITIRIREKSDVFFWNRPLTMKAHVSVSPRAVSVKFRRSKYKLVKGKTKQLRITLRPSISKEKPLYQSLNPSIATVSNKGVIKARTEGSTYIVASLSNGRQSKCRIIVKKKK